jgi:hypothetical protein
VLVASPFQSTGQLQLESPAVSQKQPRVNSGMSSITIRIYLHAVEEFARYCGAYFLFAPEVGVLDGGAIPWANCLFGEKGPRWRGAPIWNFGSYRARGRAAEHVR